MELLWVFISSLSFFLHCSLPSMSVFCGCQYSFIAFTIAWTPLDTLVTVTILWKIRWSTNLTMSVGWGGLLNDMHGGYSNAKNLFFWQHWLMTDAAVISVRTWEWGCFWFFPALKSTSDRRYEFPWHLSNHTDSRLIHRYNKRRGDHNWNWNPNGGSEN